MHVGARWIAAFAAAAAGPLSAQTTTRVSLGPGGTQGNQQSFSSSLSAGGRYVAFLSSASNLVLVDTNGAIDVFLRDRETGVTELISVDSAGVQANDDSSVPSVSEDGRFVAFASSATNLVPGDSNGARDVFVRDRQSGTTIRVSVDANGVEGNGPSGDSFRSVAISADGRFVVFESAASNLVPGDSNGKRDMFVRDLLSGTIERASLGPGGIEADDESFGAPAISSDGRFVAFQSAATNLVPGDTNGLADLFVRDRLLDTVDRVNVDSSGVPANADSGTPTISADGRFVAFDSDATNLVPGDTNGDRDAFVHDRTTGITERVSVGTGGVQANGPSGFWWPSRISADGRVVTFHSQANNLAPAQGFAFHVYAHDRQSGVTELVSVGWNGAEPHTHSTPDGISSDGRYVAFSSGSGLLVPGDTNGWLDVFVRDRTGGSDFTSLCEPGADGVLPCPCANPPAGPGRGCDNSAATGGASLSASGSTSLSSDSLVFTTSGEKPTATSVLLQGTSLAATGVVYGQGVRCVGGTLKRLFTKTASGGSITAPNFSTGDPSVSARSAAKGNPISAGQSRWYLVFYRDPIVLGGCPVTSTFNTTQTGRIDWSP